MTRKIRTQLQGCLAVMILAAIGGVAHAGIEEGFVAGWTLNETSGNFADVSGNGYTLTPTGSVYGTGSNGIVGGAMAINADTEYASNAAVANFELDQSFSVSFWFNPDRTPDVFLNILGRVNTTENRGCSIRNGGPGEREKIWFSLYRSNGSGGAVAAGTDGDFLVGGSWQHIVVVYDGDAYMNGTQIYYNGVNVASSAIGYWDGDPLDSSLTDTPFAAGKRLVTVPEAATMGLFAIG